MQLGHSSVIHLCAGASFVKAKSDVRKTSCWAVGLGQEDLHGSVRLAAVQAVQKLADHGNPVVISAVSQCLGDLEWEVS
eukprot:3325343-Amphidinium_carterae.1